eukprot:TRINITY_DN814_c0_g2_i2.p1 TRINITY_DN814_c0_g2~~TRINITY_DN814_c0_g2_i2.p1  ORF type:complete len:332 (+),score=50.22 TRINITY_DN814_c0_g2_i2:1085-2080(+)
MTLAPLVPILFLSLSWTWTSWTFRHQRLQASSCRPAVLAAHAEASRRHWVVFFAWTFFIYGTVSSVLFQSFACEQIQEWSSRPYSSYLRADYSIVCYDRRYWSYAAYAAVMVLVYPLGIPILYSYVIRRKRRVDLERKRHSDTSVAPELDGIAKSGFLTASSFVWDQYTDKADWWEIAECARRLLFTGFLVFILPGTGGQAAVSMLLAFASVVTVLMVQPHRQRSMHYQYFLGALIVFFSSVNALLLKVDVSADDAQSQVVIGILLITLSVVLIGAVVVSSLYGAAIELNARASLRNVSEAGEYARRSSSSTAVHQTQPNRAPLHSDNVLL